MLPHRLPVVPPEMLGAPTWRPGAAAPYLYPVAPHHTAGGSYVWIPHAPPRVPAAPRCASSGWPVAQLALLIALLAALLLICVRRSRLDRQQGVERALRERRGDDPQREPDAARFAPPADADADDAGQLQRRRVVRISDASARAAQTRKPAVAARTTRAAATAARVARAASGNAAPLSSVPEELPLAADGELTFVPVARQRRASRPAAALGGVEDHGGRLACEISSRASGADARRSDSDRLNEHMRASRCEFARGSRDPNTRPVAAEA